MTQELLYKEFTYKIFNCAIYISGIYKNKEKVKPLGLTSAELHERFKQDLTERLKKEGFYVKPEKYFSRPEGKDLINSKLQWRRSDLLVKDKESGYIVLIEIKCGNDDTLSNEKVKRQNEAQVLNTLEYAGLKLCMILQMKNDSTYKVTQKRKIIS